MKFRQIDEMVIEIQCWHNTPGILLFSQRV